MYIYIYTHIHVNVGPLDQAAKTPQNQKTRKPENRLQHQRNCKQARKQESQSTAKLQPYKQIYIYIYTYIWWRPCPPPPTLGKFNIKWKTLGFTDFCSRFLWKLNSGSYRQKLNVKAYLPNKNFKFTKDIIRIVLSTAKFFLYSRNFVFQNFFLIFFSKKSWLRKNQRTWLCKMCVFGPLAIPFYCAWVVRWNFAW